MAVSSSYAKNARREVGRFLVKQAGYSKKSETKFYKQGNDILTNVYLQRSRGITQVHVGIQPLYIPDSLHVLFATNLTMELLPGSILLEDDHEYKAKAWADRIIHYLNGGYLAFMEAISSPQALVDYLIKRPASDRRFVMAPLERDMLIIFSSAYLGDVQFAIEYAKAAQHKIQKEEIDGLPQILAHWDREIAKARAALASNCTGDRRLIEERIKTYEQFKEVAPRNAQNHAPRRIDMYGKWIEPFTASSFDGEAYFSQITAANKASLRYDKLFPTM